MRGPEVIDGRLPSQIEVGDDLSRNDLADPQTTDLFLLLSHLLLLNLLDPYLFLSDALTHLFVGLF